MPMNNKQRTATIKEKKYPYFTWVDIQDPSDEEANELVTAKGLSPILVKDSLQAGHLPKLEPIEEGYFMILRACTQEVDKPTSIIDFSNKIAFFVFKDRLITIHRAEYAFLDSAPPHIKHVDALVLHIVDNMVDSFQEPVENLSNKIDDMENHIFTKKGSNLTLEQLYFLKSKARIGKKLIGLIQTVINEYKPKKLIVFSRDELKQYEMAQRFNPEEHRFMRYFIGDVRDEGRLDMAMRGVDVVVHAAALKHVPIAEYNPFECMRTNVFGAENVVRAAIKRGVKHVCALSTDKAASPINLYGATKLASDKLFVSGNSYAGGHETRFAVVRYGNVMGSRGSVIPFFMSVKDQGVLPITDERMTRFMISLEEGVELVWHAFEDMEGGEIYVKKIPSMKVTDLARVVAPDAKHEIVGIRPGEKLHEQMIGAEDSYYTYEYPEHFKILPAIHDWSADAARIKDGKKVPEGFVYSSDNNTEWMSGDELQAWIDANWEKIGSI